MNATNSDLSALVSIYLTRLDTQNIRSVVRPEEILRFGTVVSRTILLKVA